MVLTVLVFLLTAYSSPLTSQQASASSAFQALRDSLQSTSDTAALRALMRTLGRRQEGHRDDLTVELRSGLVGLRLGQLHADADFGDARSSFRRASQQNSGHPEGWFGLGLAEEGRSGWEMSQLLNLGNRVGLKALERAAVAYRHALEADAGFVPAALALAGVTLRLRDTVRLAMARDALRLSAVALATPPPELLLAWGRLERAAGTPDSALTPFDRYLSLGGNRALGLLELARTRLALGRSDGEAPYYEGAAMDDAEATAEYRADLAPLLGDSGLREFDGVSGQGRAAYLRRFWTDRDRLELRSQGERLREHYRRLLFARRHFPLTISRRFYGRLDAYRAGDTDVDDRGVIYIRQGEPSKRLRPFVFGAMPNESWYYARGDGDLLFHFSGGWDQNGGGDLYDYRLVQSVLDLRGAADAPRDQLLLSRESLSPMYARMLNWGVYGAARVRVKERGIGAASIAVGTTTDSYELQFGWRLGAVADLIAVGQSSKGGLAHFVFGIAEPGTTARPKDGGVQYPVWVRLVALDSQDHAIATLDTSFTIRLPRRLAPGEYLVGRAELPLPPGRWSYRAALQQGDSAGVVLPRDSVRVANTDGPLLALSDIALGSPGRSASWVTDAADTVLLAPSGVFRQGAEVEIYYETTGAAAGLRYRHQIAVLRSDSPTSDAERRPMVSLSFDEAASGRVLRSRRMLRLERLKPGSYVVEVRVTDPDGSSQVRRRPIRLIDR